MKNVNWHKHMGEIRVVMSLEGAALGISTKLRAALSLLVQGKAFF